MLQDKREAFHNVLHLHLSLAFEILKKIVCPHCIVQPFQITWKDMFAF